MFTSYSLTLIDNRFYWVPWVYQTFLAENSCLLLQEMLLMRAVRLWAIKPLCRAEGNCRRVIILSSLCICHSKQAFLYTTFWPILHSKKKKKDWCNIKHFLHTFLNFANVQMGWGRCGKSWWPTLTEFNCCAWAGRERACFPCNASELDFVTDSKLFINSRSYSMGLILYKVTQLW